VKAKDLITRAGGGKLAAMFLNRICSRVRQVGSRRDGDYRTSRIFRADIRPFCVGQHISSRSERLLNNGDKPEWSGQPKETAMTTRSALTKFTLLTATLVTSMVLLSATNGAQARDHDGHGHSGYGDRDRDHHRDRDRDYDRDHDRDRDYDRDHDRDHDHDRDDPILVHHHGPNPGSFPTPVVVVVRDHRGAGYPGNVRDHRGLDGAPGGVTVSGGGFQGNVRDHR
jgi:hypothetical protein